MCSRVIPMALCAMLVFAATFPARAATTDVPSRATTVESLVQEAQQLLAHASAGSHLTIVVQAAGQTAIRSNPDQTRERIIDLLANAIAFAPEGSRVTVRFNSPHQRLVVAVENASVHLTTERDVSDQNGNTFHLRSMAGVGTELRLDLNAAPVLRAADR